MLHDLRCEKCGALLAREDVALGDIEIKCYRCNKMNLYKYEGRFIEALAESMTAVPAL